MSVTQEHSVAPMMSNAQIQSTYTAASGRQCQRMLSLDDTVPDFIRCQRKNGEWYTVRSLLLPGPSASLAKAAAPDAISQETLVSVGQDLPASDKDLSLNRHDASGPVYRELLPDETLWSFSRRVTGNALNWKSIAEFNELENEHVLSGGQSLAVPARLLKESDE